MFIIVRVADSRFGHGRRQLLQKQAAKALENFFDYSKGVEVLSTMIFKRDFFLFIKVYN